MFFLGEGNIAVRLKLMDDPGEELIMQAAEETIATVVSWSESMSSSLTTVRIRAEKGAQTKAGQEEMGWG